MRPRQTSRLIAPFALVLLAVLALCTAFGYVLARESDARHQDQRRASLLGVIDEFRNVFANMTADAANDFAAGDVTAAPDLARALAPMGLARYRHERACMIGSDDALIASFPGGGHVPAPVRRVIADFRAGHANLGAAADDAGGFAPVATGMIMLDGGPALVAVAAVRAAGAGGPVDEKFPVLVRTKRLDGGLIGAFEKMSGVAELAFDAEAPHADRDVASLIDAQGRMVGWLSWKREHPTMDAVVRLLPLLGAVAAGLVLFAASAIRQVGRATRRLATSEAEAHKIAYEDPVTGLPNRRMMFDLLDAALARRAGGGVSLALLDIDGFAEIKEALGEQGSDELLVAAGERLRGAIPAAVTLGRIGPSEFALVAADADGADGLAAVHTAVKVMARPLWIANQAVQTGVTAGLVHAPDDGETREELTRRADLARRSVEHGGAVRIAGFDPGMEQEFQDRLFIKRELRRTLAEQGFDVHYQPIVAAEGQKIVGVEALLRWNSPTLGEVSPLEFIPVAEDTGAIVPLGAWVLRESCETMTRIREQVGRPLELAVNVAANQMANPSFALSVQQTLAHAEFPAQLLTLEIIETALVRPDAVTTRTLRTLESLGVGIVLDDFGTGFSSLTWLKQHPLAGIKVDRSFVSGLDQDLRDQAIVTAVIGMSAALGCAVTAEGVETEEQLGILRALGCERVQGFLLARPMPAEELVALIGSPAGTGTIRA
jgi:diguanylate cyclase (GGDEF)-like protein